MRRVLLLASLTVGCGPSPPASVLPSREDVAVVVPGSGTAIARRVALVPTQATFYTLTRQISASVNGMAAMFFEVVDKALATPPTAQDATTSYWGPFTDAQSPMTAVLGVARVGAGDYNFFLGGKLKGAPDSEFAGLFGGTERRLDAVRGSGELDVNFTAMNTLDPTTHRATGGMAFLHDNTADPRTVEVHFGDFLDGAPGSMPHTAHYRYAEFADRSGSFAFTARADFDHDPDGTLEEVALTSRWATSGAGRGDLVATGGSLPTGFVVHATECWDTNFVRVYYTDDVDATKSEGDLSACALP